MIGTKNDKTFTKAQIEEKARNMGMQYPDEMRVLPNKKDVKSK